jgi:Domain of unknown function (DUF4136)
MGRVFKSILIQAMVVSLVSCASAVHVIDVPIDEPGDISGARSYCWDNGPLVAVAPGEEGSSEFSKTIRNEINLSLAGLGYRKVDDCPTDMTVGFRVTVQENVAGYSAEIPYYDDDFASPYGVKWRFGSGEKSVITEQSTTVEVTFYEEGTLHVGAFDADNKMSWHVAAEKIVDEHHSPSEHKAVLRKTIRAIMQKFPARRSR